MTDVLTLAGVAADAAANAATFAATYGAMAVGAAPLLGYRPIKNRLLERVLLGPGAAVVGFELETRGGGRHKKHALTTKPRDQRGKSRVRRYVEAKTAPFLYPAHIWHLKDRIQHVQIVGPTAMGKTTIMENLIAQDLREGMTVFVLETGGNLTKKAERHADALGRPKMIVDVSRGEDSWVFNLMEGDTEKVAQRVTESFLAVLGEEHPFFTNHNEEMLKAMVHAAKAREAQTGEAATLQTVLDCVNDEEYLREAIEVKDPTRVQGAPAAKKKGGAAAKASADIGLEVNSPYLDKEQRKFFKNRYFGTMTDRDRGDFTSGLKTGLSKLVGRQSVRKVLCPTGDGTQRELPLGASLESGGLVVLRFHPGDCGITNARNLALWALRAFMSVITERPDRSHPVMAYFDEVHNFFGADHGPASKVFESFVATARHKNCSVHCAYQGNSQIPKELAEIFEDNLRNKLILGGMGPTGAKKAQEILSSDARKIVSQSREAGESGLSISTSVEDVHRWSRDELVGLQVGEAISVRVKNSNVQYGVLIRTRLAPPAGPPASEPAPLGAPTLMEELAQRGRAFALASGRRKHRRERRKEFRGKEKELAKKGPKARTTPKAAKRAPSIEAGAPPVNPGGSPGAGQNRGRPRPGAPRKAGRG